MPRRCIDIEDLLATPNNPDFIDGIFNYCNRRCDRCAYTARCRLYADEARDRRAYPVESIVDRVRRTFQHTFDMLQNRCAREAEPVDLAAAVSAQMSATRQDPLLKLAESYTFPAMKLAEALRRNEQSPEYSSDIRDAIATIEWYGIRISSKIYRALIGLQDRAEEPDADPIQSDWNGSAKVARLEIAESRSAWEAILRAGAAPPDSPIRRIVALLDDIDLGVSERFPDAMSFVRPGFDAPDNTCAPGVVGSRRAPA